MLPVKGVDSDFRPGLTFCAHGRKEFVLRVFNVPIILISLQLDSDEDVFSFLFSVFYRIEVFNGKQNCNETSHYFDG